VAPSDETDSMGERESVPAGFSLFQLDDLEPAYGSRRLSEELGLTASDIWITLFKEFGLSQLLGRGHARARQSLRSTDARGAGNHSRWDSWRQLASLADRHAAPVCSSFSSAGLTSDAERVAGCRLKRRHPGEE
jgi:hypothetical protein